MLTLDALRDCLDGATPGVVATCAKDGTPNVAYLSQVQYVDAHHLALSWQFFTRTRANVVENPRARVLLIHPVTAARFHVDVEYLRTETAGPLFEVMKAKLAGLASHTGMQGVFKLQGADVYRVVGIVCAHGRPSPPLVDRSLFVALRRATERLQSARSANEVVTATLDALRTDFDVPHGMVWWADEARRKLVLLGSMGASAEGVGAEVGFGEGVIGVCARERVPIRITFGVADAAYGQVVRAEHARDGAALEREVPYPGLRTPQSQLAVPLVSAGQLRGVLFVEHEEPLRFGYDHEDVLQAFGAQLAALLFATQPDEPEEPPRAAPVAPGDEAVELRHYAADDSVFLGGEYLIKGVAGALLWLMVSEWKATGRVGFTNRELRLDPRLGLPEAAENLEARLLLLQRRLKERGACVQLSRPARGRLELVVSRALRLQHVA